MARIRAFITAATIVGAAHVSAGADPLLRPAMPLEVGIFADGDGGRFGGVGSGRKDGAAREHCEERETPEAKVEWRLGFHRRWGRSSASRDSFFVYPTKAQRHKGDIL